jgi:catechol 2,3-dioxygenase
MNVGAVRLTVADLDRVQSFYEDAIGLRTVDRAGDVSRLGANAVPLVELVHGRDAPARPPGTTGLFHMAILVPGRVELARSVHRIAEAGWRLTGASDHLVSEALYLRDPEGNGIEIYRDRPREEWRYDDGQVRMATLPLDLHGVLGELSGAHAEAGPMPSATRMGHVHLNVADLGAAEAFYGGTLGLEVTVRGYPGALFLSRGGYHHHIGLNTWTGEGAPPPPPGSRGLRWFEFLLPSTEELEAIEQRLGVAGIDARRDDDGLDVADPSGNRLLLKTAPQATAE